MLTMHCLKLFLITVTAYTEFSRWLRSKSSLRLIPVYDFFEEFVILGFSVSFALFTSITAREKHRTLNASKLPDAEKVWETYMKRTDFVPSKCTTAFQGHLGSFVANSLYRGSPIELKDFTVEQDMSMRSPLDVRIVYTGNADRIRPNGSLDPELAHYPLAEGNSGLSIVYRFFIDSHNQLIAELEKQGAPNELRFERAAFLNIVRFTDLVEQVYMKGYLGQKFNANFIAYLQLIPKSPWLRGLRQMMRRRVSSALHPAMMAHITYRVHWVISDGIANGLPHFHKGLNEKSCHEVIGELPARDFGEVLYSQLTSPGGAAVPHNDPVFLKQVSIHTIEQCRHLKLSYNDVLRSLSLPPITSFDQFQDGELLKSLYGDPEHVELYIGNLADRRTLWLNGNFSVVGAYYLFTSAFLDDIFFGYPVEVDKAGILSTCSKFDRKAMWKILLDEKNHGTLQTMIHKIYGVGSPKEFKRMTVLESFRSIRETFNHFSSQMYPKQAE